MSAKQLVVDTDIGTDVDDALVLLQIVGSRPDYEIAITTAYGDVQKRACIANSYLNLLGSSISIYPGEEKVISGKEIWVSGIEGNLHEEFITDKIRKVNAVDYILSSSSDPKIETEILAIAPITNIAHVVDRSSDASRHIKNLYVMAGRFAEGKCEHNIVSDIVAAQRVFRSNLNMSVVGIEITSRLKMNVREFEFLNDLGSAARLLFSEIVQWANFWNRDWIVPHDSIAYLLKSNPELFQFSSYGDIEVRNEGHTTFCENPLGTKRIVQDMDVERVRLLITSSIEGVKFSS